MKSYLKPAARRRSRKIRQLTDNRLRSYEQATWRELGYTLNDWEIASWWAAGVRLPKRKGRVER